MPKDNWNPYKGGWIEKAADRIIEETSCTYTHPADLVQILERALAMAKELEIARYRQ